ncbi:MAG: hypothetical protein GY855_13635 [candidate division Zixibacteria bacterium]|nr:hypothetical protein [candidate division Zixibacteria bacterium]
MKLNYSLFLLYFFSTMIFQFSCGPKPEKVDIKEEAIAPAVSNLSISAANGRALLKWDSMRKKQQIAGGYEIYLVPQSTKIDEKLKPFNTTRYPGDEDGDPSAEIFEAENLENIGYKGWIVSYSANGLNTLTSDTIEFYPMIEGKIVLNLRYSTKGSGYSFANSKNVPVYSDESDIRLVFSNNRSMLSSPSKLNEKLRTSKFSDTGMMNSFSKLINFKPNEYLWKESLPLVVGKTYLVKTNDGYFAKLVCYQIAGEGGRLQAHFRYVYNPIPNYYRFQ